MAVLGVAGALPGVATAGNGGTFASVPGSISSVTCRSLCAGLQRAQPGSTVRVTGEGLADAGQIVFLGARGPADDVSAPATVIDETAVEAMVPSGARTGKVVVVNAD